MPLPSKARTWIRGIAIFVAVASAIGHGAVFLLESKYTGKAVLAQRVVVDKTADALFGEGGRQVISKPEPLIIDDPKAFLSGTGENGSRLVDENYLKEHNIYPEQLRTVMFTLVLFRVALAISLLVSVLVALALREKKAA